MPEPYWPKRKNSYTLGDAERLPGRLVRIRCRYCKREHYYEIADLRVLLGNIEVDDVAYSMKCSGCGKDRTLELELLSISAEDRQKTTVRRLVAIRYLRRPVWRDERPS